MLNKQNIGLFRYYKLVGQLLQMIELFHMHEVVLSHDFHQLFKAGFAWIPAQLCFGLGGVAQQMLHLGGAEKSRINLHQHLAGGFVDAFFVDAIALSLEFDAGMVECQGAELAHGVILAGSHHKVIGLVLLQNEPHALHIVACIAPVATGIEVA